MYRTHTCGELRLSNVGNEVSLSGWVQRTREMGGMTFVDLRDRYGITQLAFSTHDNDELNQKARKLGREFVVQVKGEVIERSSKNKNIPTGEVEIKVTELNILNAAKTPPFTIEDETDGGDEQRMKYRYLDIRRNTILDKLRLRNKVALETRKFLDSVDFMDVETPYLIKSTPEGARDFVVPSRMNEGEFYALPQSPQTFKQLLMVSGYDKYYQIVKCFRDEDLRADRQPEFTQIDCEMSFVDQNDVINMFEGMLVDVFKKVKDIDLTLPFPRLTYEEAMRKYGNDKPDIRFGMELCTLKAPEKDLHKNQPAIDFTSGAAFKVMDDAEFVVGIAVPGGSEWSRKQIDEWTKWVKRPQIGMNGLMFVRYNQDGSIKSSIDKFYSEDQLKEWLEMANAQPGDLLFILVGNTDLTRKAISELRLAIASNLGLRNKEEFAPLWVVDFLLLEYTEEDVDGGGAGRWIAKHHPFTAPKPEHIDMMDNEGNYAFINANAYDIVLNGHEIGGGSIRIFQKELQMKMFEVLGIQKEEAEEKFGFLLSAFEYGAPPHGGIAFGFDRLCALMGGNESIRDYIAFPKNNSGRDVMLDAPSLIDEKQLNELGLKIK